VNPTAKATLFQQSKALNSTVLPALVWLFLILLVTFSIYGLSPVRPVPASASAHDFSAERAMRHIRVIARAPHPMGSSANDTVRQYLLDQLSSLGFDPHVFSGIGVVHDGGYITAGTVHDVIGRINGQGSSGTIMLVAHYDSVRSSPGAGDDAAGVAAILETLRAMRNGPGLRNDVIALFTDGEEAGLLGAEAFARSHEWMKDVDLILNFEARGDHGPSLMFETSSQNRQLIQEFRKAAPHPIASSLFYTLYQLLPTDTDFSVFRTSKSAGMNFAFGDNFKAYHSRLDTVENLSAASVQHHGSYALSLLRHFGQIDLSELKRQMGDEVFFDLYGDRLIAYPVSWVIPGQVAIALALCIALLLWLRRSRIHVGRLVSAMGLHLASLVIISGCLALAWCIVSLLLSRWQITGVSSDNSLQLVGFALLATATAIPFFHIFRQKFTVEEMTLAGLLVLCLFSIAFSLVLPTGSYLFFWPLVLLAIGWLLFESTSTKGPISLLCANIPGSSVAILIITPMIYLACTFLGLGYAIIATEGALVGLLFTTSPPMINLAVPCDKNRRRILVAAVLFIAVGSLAAGTYISRPSSENPGRDTILYSLNVDKGTAVWMSPDEIADSWTSTLIAPAAFSGARPMPDFLAGVMASVSASPAPIVDLPAPSVTIHEDATDKNLHKLRLFIQSHRNADAIRLNLANDITAISANIEGIDVPLDRPAGPLRFNLLGMGQKPIQVSVTLLAPSGVSLWLADESVGLPLWARPRPDNLMPSGLSDVTIICRKYTFP
jgi:hypothetical protein